MYYPITQPATGIEIWPLKTAVWRYNLDTHNKHVLENSIWWGKDGTNGTPAFKRMLSTIDNSSTPLSVWSWQDVGHNQDAKREVQALNVNSPFSTPKPEKLIHRIVHIASNEGDLVMDSFLGSATTAAVAHKMKRNYIGIELGEHAVTHCHPRLENVVDGEQGGISKALNWQGGGGFKFYRLGEVIFNESGALQAGISFQALAAHIWFSIARKSLPTAVSEKLNSNNKSPLIGVFNGTAIYLLYNGILGDKRPQGGNVLTSKVLAILPEHPENSNGKKLIFGETSRMGSERLIKENIIFKQIPYDIKGR